MTRNWRGSIAALSLFVASAAWAHNGQEHVMGTVVSADAKSIVVKTTKGAETTVQVDDRTRVERDGKPAQMSDLAAGERVVVHARKGDAGLTANVIKAGGANSDKMPTHAQTHTHTH